MHDKPHVILSGFADEAANQKTAEQQFAAFAALGLQYYTVRFVDAGNGIKNVMDLSKSEVGRLRRLHERDHLIPEHSRLPVISRRRDFPPAVFE